MEKLLRYISNPALFYLKLSQLFGILPFMIKCESVEENIENNSVEETVENVSAGRELNMWTDSKTMIKYKVKFSAGLMLWCVAVRLMMVTIIVMAFIKKPYMDSQNVLLFLMFFYVLGGLTMIFSLKHHKAMINSILKMWSDEKGRSFKLRAGVISSLLQNFVCGIIPLMSDAKLDWYIESLSSVVVVIIATLWTIWSSNFFKHLCSCMKMKVIKIQHKLRHVGNDDAQKFLHEVNKVRILLLPFL